MGVDAAEAFGAEVAVGGVAGEEGGAQVGGGADDAVDGGLGCGLELGGDLRVGGKEDVGVRIYEAG